MCVRRNSVTPTLLGWQKKMYGGIIDLVFYKYSSGIDIPNKR